MLRRFAGSSLFLVLLAGCGGSSNDAPGSVSAGPGGGGEGGMSGNGGAAGGDGVTAGGAGGVGGSGGSPGAGGAPGTGGSGGDSAGGAAAQGGDGGAPSGGASGSGGDPGFGGNTDVGMCVAAFGNGLSNTYGRIDGTLVAVVRPQDQQCAMPNSHHTILEVQMLGAYYRLLINVDSVEGTDPRVQFHDLDAPLVGMPYSEGWHTTGVSLDYVKDLGLQSTDFTPLVPADLVNKIVSELTLGDPISVYLHGFGPDGGHDIHYYGGGSATDGAVFLHPKDPVSHVLAFHFATDMF